mgnify:CR=1 FL=1
MKYIPPMQIVLDTLDLEQLVRMTCKDAFKVNELEMRIGGHMVTARILEFQPVFYTLSEDRQSLAMVLVGAHQPPEYTLGMLESAITHLYPK